MKRLLSFVFILICMPSYAMNEAYQQKTADIMAILKNIEAQNEQLQAEVDAYTKENQKIKSKAGTVPTPKPKVVQKPPTLLTPMDREAMSSAIFFAGGAPRPIPQKRENNFRPPTKSDISSNNGANKDNPSTDDKSDNKNSDNSDNDTSSDYSSYSGGGGYYPTNGTQIKMSYTTSDTSDPTFSYPTTLSPVFNFSSKLTLSQNTYQRTNVNGIYTNITLNSVQFCNSSFNTSSCFSAGSISDGTLNISNTTIQEANTKGFVGFTESSSDSSVQTPTFYFLGTDTNSNTYKYTVNYPSSSGDLTCTAVIGSTSCKQQQSTLTQAISLSQ